MSMFRKATGADVEHLADLYERIHDADEAGKVTVFWKRGVYPTRQTILDALSREDLFVEESEDGEIVATGIINQIPVPEYENCAWEHEAKLEDIMILHTLVVDPLHARRGYAKAFVQFYEEYAREHGCSHLRMDTREANVIARRLYQSLGFSEPGIVDCIFNGIPDVKLVCLEKKLR